MYFFIGRHYTTKNIVFFLVFDCIGNYFNVNADDICSAIENYEPSNNRSQLKKTDKNVLILDAYNANPTSMKAALENFINVDSQNKVVVIGDMLELGNDSDDEHKRIVSFLKNSNLKYIFLIGPVFSKIENENNFKTFENVDLAKDWFKKNKIENSTILIKGSRGIKLEKLIEVF